MSNRKPYSLFAFFFLIISLIFSLLPAIIVSAKEISGVSKDQTFYTQFSLFYEKGHYHTTNYHKGILLPVNSEVKFVKAYSKSIVVTLPNSENLEIINVEGFSGEKIEEIFTRTFSASPVDLSKFTGAEKKAILAGKVEKGMTKAAVIAAFGYPPKHKTPNLETEQWRYWLNRFDTIVVIFENDKVVRIEN